MEINSSNVHFNQEEKSNDWPWFHIGQPAEYNCLNPTQPIYIQDTIHIATKLRTRFLKPNIILPIGKYFATVDHLKEIIAEKTKDQYKFTISDLRPDDKMNYNAAEKIMEPHVSELLSEIPNSEGTRAYLKIMFYVTTAFNDPDLCVEDRIYRLWFSVFFLRIWRAWILNKQEYTLKNNFITSNCFSCIELNAHSMIRLVKSYHKNNEILKPELFVPCHFSSQPCEKLFRATRSFTSTFSTVVNFTMYEIINRLHRIEMLNVIKNDLSDTLSVENPFNRNCDEVKFTFSSNYRIAKEKKKSVITNKEEPDSMTDDKIKQIIDKCLLDV